MPDYSLGKIYCIRSPNTKSFYIGSTTQPLYKRFWTHKASYNAFKKTGKKCTRSCVIFEAGNPYIELIQNYKCSDKGELNRREGELIRQYKDICCNRCVAGRSQKEYQTDNKDKLRVKNAQYYQKNKDKIKEYQDGFRKRNKNKINKIAGEYRQKNKAKIKVKKAQYREKNKEKIKMKEAEYYKKNKDKIALQRKVKAPCPHCDKIMRKDTIPKHIRKHCKKVPK